MGLTLCILDNFTMNLRNLIALGVKPFSVCVPDSKERWLFTRSSAFGLLLQTVDVRKRRHGSGDIPRETKERMDTHADGDDEHVQMVADAFL